MAFNHAKVFNGFCSNCKLNAMPINSQKSRRKINQNDKCQLNAHSDSSLCMLCTYVAPMVFNFRNCGVNWYRTYRPAFVSIILVSSIAFDITSSLAGALVVSSTLPSGNCSLGGFAISNRTVPLSRSRILKRVKSMSYTFASVVSNPFWV